MEGDSLMRAPKRLRISPASASRFKDAGGLSPADGFYEWQRSEKTAQPYFFHMRDESPFAVAGIWDEWQRDGNVIASCAIVMTTANELLASIHDLICRLSCLPNHRTRGLTATRCVQL